MQVEGSGYGAQRISPRIADPHDHTAIELALCRAVAMDSASQETPIRTEKPAGMGMFIRKRVIAEDLPLVLINPGYKLRTGRNRFAGKLKLVQSGDR